MKNVVCFVLILAMALMCVACSSQTEKDTGDPQTDTAADDIASEADGTTADDIASEADGPTPDEETEDVGDNMDGFAVFVEKAEEMAAFLNEAIDKADTDGLGFDLSVLTSLGLQMQGAYVNYEQHGDDWDDRVESEEWGIITDTSIHKQDGIYTYTNVAYDYENPDDIIEEMRVLYDKDNRLVHKYSHTPTPPMETHDQYYLDESGRLYYFLTELAGDTLYVNMVYYDGSFIGAAKKDFEGQTQMELLYDFTQQTPQSFEDLLVVDGFNLYLTYDGQTCTVEGDNY